MTLASELTAPSGILDARWPDPVGRKRPETGQRANSTRECERREGIRISPFSLGACPRVLRGFRGSQTLKPRSLQGFRGTQAGTPRSLLGFRGPRRYRLVFYMVLEASRGRNLVFYEVLAPPQALEPRILRDFRGSQGPK